VSVRAGHGKRHIIHDGSGIEPKWRTRANASINAQGVDAAKNGGTGAGGKIDYFFFDPRIIPALLVDLHSGTLKHLVEPNFAALRGRVCPARPAREGAAQHHPRRRGQTHGLPCQVIARSDVSNTTL
jgi:hypothetical protein